MVIAAIIDTRKGESLAQQFNKLDLEVRAKRFERLTDAEKVKLKYQWEFWARPDQMLPDGEWQTWLIKAGRGFGKTRVGAESVRRWVRDFAIVNIIAPTADDARDICIEGESGILAICPNAERPAYLASKRKLEWPNGAVSLIFTADEPERLRGKQHMKLWCDELAAWRYIGDAWTQAMFGLRLGTNPQALVTTTPKPLKEIKELIADPMTFLTNGTTYENRINLAKEFYSRIIKKYEGTRLGRQELNAELLEDNPNALFHRSLIDLTRLKDQALFDQVIFPKFKRIVGAIDPAVTSNEDSDETGIVFAGHLAWADVPQQFKELCKFPGDHFVVFDDRSGIYSPDKWAEAALAGYKVFKADRLVGEVNNGGEMIEATLRHADANVAYTALHASRGKQTRAEPISALYEQHRVHHVGSLSVLEDQMCFPAGTMIETDRGPVPIELVCVNNYVKTRIGYCPVRWAGQTGESKEFIAVTYSDGCIIATPCHPIFISCQSRFVRAESVLAGQLLHVSRSLVKTDGQSRGADVGGEDLRVATFDTQKESYFTALSGKLIADRFPSENSRITRTGIPETTCQVTCASLPLNSTARSTDFLDGAHGVPREDRLLERKLGRREVRSLTPVLSAGYLEKQFPSIQDHTVRVLAVEKLLLSEYVPVFNLSVTAANEFFADNILVHNCDYEPATCTVSPDRMDAVVWALTELSESIVDISPMLEMMKREAGAIDQQRAQGGVPVAAPLMVGPQNFTGCPQCMSTSIQNVSGSMRCMDCGNQWAPAGGVKKPYFASRNEILAQRGR